MEEMTETADRAGFDRRMTKEEINALPIRRYAGRVHLVREQCDVLPAVQELERERILGFDTETRPTFKKGQSFPPALIQLACRRAVYLFQLAHVQFDAALRGLLAKPGIVKAGVAVDRDIKELRALADFEPGGFLDLGTTAKEAGIQNHGLRGLVAVCLGFRIAKGAQRSNWGRADLTDTQIRYAATDAWVGRELHIFLTKNGYCRPHNQRASRTPDP